MELFQDLQTNNQIEKWVPLLDWLLSNNRFSKEKGWDAQRKSRFTKRLKNLSGISKDGWRVQAAKKAVWEFDKTEDIQVVMNSDNAEGESFVRHIRNGIAHGSVHIEKLNGKLYMDIEDYKDDSHKMQTAHMWMPVDTMFDVHKLYFEIEKQKIEEKTKATNKTKTTNKKSKKKK